MHFQNIIFNILLLGFLQKKGPWNQNAQNFVFPHNFSRGIANNKQMHKNQNKWCHFN